MNQVGDRVVRGLCLNLGGQADIRIPDLLHTYEQQFPALDFYVFLETMWEGGGWGALTFTGFNVHHCTRPERAPDAQGRPSGGITVLLRKESGVVGSPTARVRSQAKFGIVWVEVDAWRVTFAFCYFSPPDSKLYETGVLSPHYLQALSQGMASAHRKGHQIVCMGDFNIRIGARGDDVSGVPINLGPEHQFDIGHPTAGVPAARTSCDRTVPHRSAADTMLLELNTQGCVVLNGRAPGDLGGRFTCYKHNGNSVVDYGIVSATLFGSVHSFTVQDFDSTFSSDHAALVLVVALQGPQPTAQPGRSAAARGSRTYRPTPDQVINYVDELKSKDTVFKDLLQQLERGVVSPDDALQSLVTHVTQCARKACVNNRPGPVAGQDAPWFNDECAAKRDGRHGAWLVWQAWRGDGDTKKLLHDAMLTARRAYKQVVRAAKRAFEQQRQIDLISTYFSTAQRNFWRVFTGGRAPSCPISSVEEWTAHFSGIMGQPPQPQLLSFEELSARQALYAASAQDPVVLAVLNDPLTIDEVAAVMGCLPSGKAPDCQGLTCELLKAPARDLSEDHPTNNGPPPPPEYACRPFVECVTMILQQIMGGTAGGQPTLPRIMQVSKLTPVPKPDAASDPGNKNKYRGICSSSIFSRVLDRIMRARLDGIVENLGVRAPTQCGFREAHGCLDAVFVLHHLINKARHLHKQLWVTFVDFKKAFDLVRRDLLLDRCRQLGIHGEFMDALVMLYDNIILKVVVNGATGTEFDTYLGTKQGSELSPLLFGLFMDFLHVMAEEKVAGGPIVGNLCVPDLMYADDVTLVSFSQENAQKLLDCLDLFCKLFAMEVNLEKTFAVVFRPPRGPLSNVPAGAKLSYRGVDVRFREEFRYLGVLFSANKGLAPAADLLADSGRKALFALLPLLRQCHISQFDMRCRMFDVLVEPVMSYASHVWGPDMFKRWLLSRGSQSCQADDVHFLFLRYCMGVGKRIHKEVLLREFHRLPLPFRWLLLAANWWEKLRAMSEDRLARQAWEADIELMLSGCQECWSFKLLSALETIRVVRPDQWRRGAPGVSVTAVVALEFARDDVGPALLRLQRERWSDLVGSSLDPRTGPSEGTHLRTHVAWVHNLAPDAEQGRHNAPKYMKLCLSMPKLQCLARYRAGGHHLQGRLSGNSERGSAQRACRLCSRAHSNAVWQLRMIARCGGGRDEDLMHFMLECPAYDHIREDYPGLFSNSRWLWRRLSPNDRMLHVFNHADQATLATCVWHMNLYRAELLGLPRPADAYVHRQPSGYVPSDPALRCAADNALTPLPRVYYYAIIISLVAAVCLAYYILLTSVLGMRHRRAS